MSRRQERRGPACEGLVFRLSEGPRRAARPPWTLTWLGEGVVEVPGVGLFARWTTASVEEEVAARYRGLPGWRIDPSR